MFICLQNYLKLRLIANHFLLRKYCETFRGFSADDFCVVKNIMLYMFLLLFRRYSRGREMV